MKTNLVIEESRRRQDEARTAWRSITAPTGVGKTLAMFGITEPVYVSTWVYNVYGPEQKGRR